MESLVSDLSLKRTKSCRLQSEPTRLNSEPKVFCALFLVVSAPKSVILKLLSGSTGCRAKIGSSGWVRFKNVSNSESLWNPGKTAFFVGLLVVLKTKWGVQAPLLLHNFSRFALLPLLNQLCKLGCNFGAPHPQVDFADGLTEAFQIAILLFHRRYVLFLRIWYTFNVFFNCLFPMC